MVTQTGLHLSSSRLKRCLSLSGARVAITSHSLFSLLVSRVHCQITPDSCKGETPSVEPWCPRLPVPWRRGTFPAHTSMCCSQSKSGSSPEYLQCVAQCVSRAGTQQGTRPNVGHWLWELSSNCARHKPQALPTSGIRQGRQPKLSSCFV